jgi:hypothetical protein
LFCQFFLGKNDNKFRLQKPKYSLPGKLPVSNQLLERLQLTFEQTTVVSWSGGNLRFGKEKPYN